MTDDELAFVLAHEVAHIEKSHTHIHNQIVDAELTALKTTMAAADRNMKNKGAGFVKRAATQIIGGVAGAAGVMFTSRQMSQKHENEADSRAVEIAKDAGFDGAAGAGALKKTYGGSIPETGILKEIVGTHPAPRKRVQNVEKKAKS